MENPNCFVCGKAVTDINNSFVLPLGIMHEALGRRVGVADLALFLFHPTCRPFPYLNTLARVAESEDRARKSREWDLRLARRHNRNLPKDAEKQILAGVWPSYLPKKESLIARERGSAKPEGKPAEKSNGNSGKGEAPTA